MKYANVDSLNCISDRGQCRGERQAQRPARRLRRPAARAGLLRQQAGRHAELRFAGESRACGSSGPIASSRSATRRGRACSPAGTRTRRACSTTRTYFRTAHPDWVSLPQHFQAQGYVTARTGKIFHGGIDDTDYWTIGGEPRVDQKTRPRQNPGNSDRIVEAGRRRRIARRLQIGHAGRRAAGRAEGQAVLPGRRLYQAAQPADRSAEAVRPVRSGEDPLPPDFAARPTVPPGFPAAIVPARSGDLFIGRDASPEGGPRDDRGLLRLAHVRRSAARPRAGQARIGSSSARRP